MAYVTTRSFDGVSDQNTTFSIVLLLRHFIGGATLFYECLTLGLLRIGDPRLWVERPQ